MRPLLLLCIVMLSACSHSTTAKGIDSTPVSEFDLERYMGTWFEIARFDNRFERNLINVKAQYELLSNGKVKVVNSGVNSQSGEWQEAVGKARTTRISGRLEVSFFWIFYSPYIVLELDSNYEWALVGSRSDKYLWILSRTAKLPQPTIDHIFKRAKARGYDTTKLMFVEQSPNL